MSLWNDQPGDEYLEPSVGADDQKVSAAACGFIRELTALSKEYNIGLDVLLKKAIDNLDDMEPSGSTTSEKEV